MLEGLSRLRVTTPCQPDSLMNRLVEKTWVLGIRVIAVVRTIGVVSIAELLRASEKL